MLDILGGMLRMHHKTFSPKKQEATLSSLSGIGTGADGHAWLINTPPKTLSNKLALETVCYSLAVLYRKLASKDVPTTSGLIAKC